MTGTPIANLLDDHVHIMGAIDAIEIALRELTLGNRMLAFFEAAFEFIHTYADGAHYDKEEVLFAALLKLPAPYAGGPIACLEMEHGATRALAPQMQHAIAAIKAGNDAAWFELADAFARFAAIIRVHIPKENSGFFPMSDQVLPAPIQAELAEKFAEIDGALPMPLKDAAQALRDQVQGAAAQPAAQPAPQQAPDKFSDRFLLYDPRLAGVLAGLEADARRR